ncbi:MULTISPECIES: aminotransferase class III-fold pyridoxal phosphate-dependent enzyme [unclassified Oleiphilus]|uniref:aminotransferase class III-fold pyridoxal phosphate-dependent enzyme n=3 Tax=Oleiphilus TaxID=141450 RepID=UPI0009EF02F2|nr:MULTISPECIES: aminotransferase class III-fold pyridoxal phosphate-dependent enzyme [unclassified Oleiphilus]
MTELTSSWNHEQFVLLMIALVIIYSLYRIAIRLQLSKAKHPSLRGHAKMSKQVAKLLPYYRYNDARVFSCDNAPEHIAAQRQASFNDLKERLTRLSPNSIAASKKLEGKLSDVDFTNRYRVPFQFRAFMHNEMPIGLMADTTSGTQIRDLDGNWSYDLTGAYGVNLYGYDFYKECMDEGIAQTRELGAALGPYHPLIINNTDKLKDISGLDEVSYHMSGTEAVMQAVRLAHYHTGKKRTVVFCGAYHGWWDGVQPGIGNPRKVHDVYTLKEMSNDTLRVLKTRKDIACVLVNPLQALNPNGGSSSDSMLIASDRSAHFDKEAYTVWLKALREICTKKNIVMIMDEVFLGFRLAKGGAQEYFGVQADMVTYGKTLGGGLPVGVVCGKAELMKRYKEHKPTDICFARGTFNAHPYVMGAMNAFLKRVEQPKYLIEPERLDKQWNTRARVMNEVFQEAGIPIKVANMASVFVPMYTQASRYNWMYQYYLRAEGLLLPWIGTGRFIFSHNYSDEEFETVIKRMVAAGIAMQHAGWWWQAPALTNKSIKRDVLRELVKTKLSAKSKLANLS